MVKNGQLEIRQVSFVSPRHRNIPVEVLDRADLFARFEAAYFRRPDRPTFTTLMLVHRGHGTHTVDFEQVELAPGRIIRIDPQQVHSWDVDSDLDMTLVLSTGSNNSGASWQSSSTPGRNLGRESLGTATALIDALRVEQARFDGKEPSVRVMVYLFEALNALHDRAEAGLVDGQLPQAYVDYRNAIERSLGSTHSSSELIRDLGYSDRTISRACQRVAGLTAKGVLTERLMLEAKRLLAHTDQPVSTIALELGFSEATNFHKFFVRYERRGPSEFRHSAR